MSKPNHRIPTKQTPFSTTTTNNGASSSRHQRTTMTTSIRKAKRGQTVARKRHMNMQFGTKDINTTSSDDGGGKMANNPYSRDGQHVKEAIQLAQSIVRLCSTTTLNNLVNETATVMQQQFQLATALDRLCVLLTPDDADINPSSQQLNISHDLNYCFAASTNNGVGGASYDSSMAGMAANAILSQFITDGSGGNDNNLAVVLANSLGSILSTKQQQNTNVVDSINSLQIKAVIVLNQLAATDPPPPQQHQQQLSSESNTSLSLGAPPKEIPTSWCHVIVNSTALSSLLQHLLPNAAAANNNSTTHSNIALCEKCVFVIGNLLGDSFMARQALLELGALSSLIACVGLGLERIKILGQQQHQQQQVDSLVIVLQLLRNSIWSLINFIRGGDTSSSSSTTAAFMTELQRVDLAVLLSLPESIQSITNNVECISASFDVAIETCWLIVFLTNHNEAATFGIENWLSKEVLLGLVTRLCSGVDASMIRYKEIDDDLSTSLADESSSLLASDSRIAYKVSNSSLPCCRALTNIAIYLDSFSLWGAGEEISQAKQGVTSALLSDMTASCLVELISLGSIGGGSEASTIACSATSLASICLTNASHDFENYQSSAVWSLLPALVQGLIAPMSFFEFHREIVWAIWNMIQRNRLQHRLLVELIGTSAEEVATSLTGMLTALQSSDAVEPSLGIVDMLLRTLDDNHTRATTGKSLKILFEEVGLVDALWYVCDNDVDESDVAEKAAELIDDFYEEQEEDEEGVDEMMPSVNGQQFQFQAPTNTGQFNFS
mmetsp:Transcript_9671/g.19506  ORF Transcript_9671/g.19506 Transcript_9671/m.19506 type:complete len:781 (+) Transcript_9671:189-2531(+)